jgi:hypothetical protein
VDPVIPPQEASIDTFVGVAAGTAEEVAVAMEEDEVMIFPEEARYQFSAGSPKHSPTVTPR